MSTNKGHIRGGFYAPANVVEDFDNEAAKHSKKISRDTGATVSLSRGDFIGLLAHKLKSGEIKL